MSRYKIAFAQAKIGGMMTNFEDLESSLRIWTEEAIAHLVRNCKPRISRGMRRWDRDEDGVIGRRESEELSWPRSVDADLLALPSWKAVRSAIESDDRLRNQIGQMLGTGQRTHRFQELELALHVLPTPLEVESLQAAFSTRYSVVDNFLASDELPFVAVWPIAGLSSDHLPVTLEDGIEIDRMSDPELFRALDVEVYRSSYFLPDFLMAEESAPLCLRYSFTLPKVVGEWTNEDKSQMDRIYRHLDDLSASLEQVFALVFEKPPGISGRAVMESGWSAARGVAFTHGLMSDAQKQRRTNFDPNVATEILSTWHHVRHARALSGQKGLNLALRRLSYQARRHDDEDVLVDILIAAEALYLSDLKSQTELGFRLALRAAALSDPKDLGISQRDVFDLMRSAYSTRSAIVHGATLRPKDLKLNGEPASLGEFTNATARVVRHGAREAATRAGTPEGWPPDWDLLTLPQSPRTGESTQ